uniref:Uncharacterized protein n=1 Tax=Pseudictyota dubia TaxID=2749911 RepID=A0A7R9WF74_9STRA|mmetsp:Transcript_45261/g.83737  ORF Transcript_45261/g.83737 Transcript_45261/m.83737 type:complete len:102 (+) Transcript_45261:147-452(+)
MTTALSKVRERRGRFLQRRLPVEGRDNCPSKEETSEGWRWRVTSSSGARKKGGDSPEAIEFTPVSGELDAGPQSGLPTRGFRFALRPLAFRFRWNDGGGER